MAKKPAAKSDPTASADADNLHQLPSANLPPGRPNPTSSSERFHAEVLKGVLDKFLSNEPLTDHEGRLLAAVLRSLYDPPDVIWKRYRDSQPMRETEVIQLPFEPPTRPPALWKDRDLNARETVTDFIERTYAQWLDRGLERRHIAKIDPLLYKSLSVFLTRQPQHPLATRLPSKRKTTQELIERLSADYSADELRKVGYAIDAQLRRSAKK